MLVTSDLLSEDMFLLMKDCNIKAQLLTQPQTQAQYSYPDTTNRDHYQYPVKDTV